MKPTPAQLAMLRHIEKEGRGFHETDARHGSASDRGMHRSVLERVMAAGLVERVRMAHFPYSD